MYDAVQFCPYDPGNSSHRWGSIDIFRGIQSFDERGEGTMKDDELIEILEDAGLSPYQAETYVTLLELGSASATDIVDACKVPDPRIYDVLRDLEEKGYVETYQQDSLNARAHDPKSVLDNLRSRSSQYLHAAESIEDRWNQPAVTEHEVSIVKRFDTIRNMASKHITDARMQIEFAGHIDEFRAMHDELLAAHERGVTIKVSLWTGENDVDLPDRDALSTVCTEARVRDIPSAFVVIVDRTSTCFSPYDQSANEYGVLVSDPDYTFTFHWFFLTALWDGCETLYTERTGQTPRTYVEIPFAARDIEEHLDAGATVSVSVRGYETETNASRVVEGVVTDIIYSRESTERGRKRPLTHMLGRLAILVDTGDEIVEVGGWNAFMEDIESERITIEAVDVD